MGPRCRHTDRLFRLLPVPLAYARRSDCLEDSRDRLARANRIPGDERGALAGIALRQLDEVRMGEEILSGMERVTEMLQPSIGDSTVREFLQLRTDEVDRSLPDIDTLFAPCAPATGSPPTSDGVPHVIVKVLFWPVTARRTH